AGLDRGGGAAGVGHQGGGVVAAVGIDVKVGLARPGGEGDRNDVHVGQTAARHHGAQLIAGARAGLVGQHLAAGADGVGGQRGEVAGVGAHVHEDAAGGNEGGDRAGFEGLEGAQVHFALDEIGEIEI